MRSPKPTSALQFVALATTLTLALAACSSESSSPSPSVGPSAASSVPSASAEPSVSGPPSTALDEVAAWDVTAEVAPDWPVLVADSLWVLVPDGDDPAVLRLDPETGEEQARISTPGGSCEGIAGGFDSIWACAPDGMVRIDPATEAIVATITFEEVPFWFGRPAVSEDAVWMLSGDVAGDAVVRIDPATNAVTATYPLGHPSSQLAFGLGYLWATATRDGLLLRIDPASGAVTTAAEDLVDPYTITTGADRVWVGLQWVPGDEDPDPSVPDLFRFDPAAGTGESFDYDLRQETLNDMAVIDDAVWIQGTDPFLFQVDPESGDIERIITSDRGSGAIVLDGDALFLSLWRDNGVVRIDL